MTKNSLRIIFIVLFFTTGSNILHAGKHRSVTLVPQNGSPVTLIVSGKEKEYYSLTGKKPLRVQVDGPGKLVILSRLKLKKSVADMQTYTLVVMDGKTVVKKQSTQTDKSDVMIKGADDVAGKSRKFSLNVPEGSYTYDLSTENSTQDVAVKFLFQSVKGGGKLVSVEPLSYDKVVSAIIKENIVAYYVSTKEHPVQFRVVGPTKVQVGARLNYDDKMKGAQKYSLVMNEGKNVVLQRSLQTTKSTGLNYQEWKEVVPGKTNIISIKVPSGEHTYAISLGEGAGKSVSLRFSIPKSDLKNEH